MSSLLAIALSASFITGCRTDPDKDEGTTETGLSDDTGEAIDLDGDGVNASEDCDDNDPSAYPGAEEICDGVDNDCDGVIDGAGASDASTWYSDADADGYGDDSSAEVACEGGSGQVDVGGDCDDADPLYNPGATEDDCADPNDYNCDGSVGYADADGDGFAACEECDDSDAAISPDAIEVCDGVDNDCDTLVDDADDSLDSSTGGTFYSDGDGDGYGDAATATMACDAPSGTVEDSSDCDDGDPAINPAATEVCDGVDNDCDALIDDADDSLDSSTGSTWYADVDGDGYGDVDVSTQACDAPSATTADDSDCDDSDGAINPSAIEVCDGVDNDCDTLIDDDDDSLDSSTASIWYADSDGDGEGDADVSTLACDAPSGTTADDSDCDDGDGAINTSATEICDGADNDCDALIDDADDSLDSSTASTWYADTDGDGEGDADVSTLACDAPSATTADDSDCDDSDGAINTSASEICDGVDNDCDTLIDDDDDSLDSSTADTWYLDGDGDGYGDDATTALSCDAPSSYVEDGGDCDDADGSYNPSASETCDGGDDNCDGSVDEGLLGTGASCPADDCNAVLADGQTADGSYSLTGASGAVIDAYCDLNSDSGGWTMVGSLVNEYLLTGTHSRSWDGLAVWTDTTTFGAIADRQTGDYKGEAFYDIAGDDVMIVTSDYSFAFYNVVGAQDFASHVNVEYDSSTCSQNFLASGADWYDGMTADQSDAFSWVVRPLDTNASCFPNGNENAIIGVLFPDCCWTIGLGNTPSGYASWDDYDLSLVNGTELSTGSCTAGTYPCNDAGAYYDGSNSYTTSNKTTWAEIYVR